ncbi:hypothetical protein BE11_41225 [Sorangium cellulosum]|nr:hypothetical protein BE11_41225 [Sorangium cellulosum]
MNPQQAEIYARIEALPLDAESASFPFTARLAAGNGWSVPFARRAVAEYRRFLLLAATAGHPVSPSDEIDQVWHLHLLYTRSYWEDLCGRALRRPLHHEPTRGGREEQAKLADWYARTLESYRRVFGEEPPPDLWPAPAARWRPGRRFQRIDVTAWRRLPRIRLDRGGLALLAAIAALISASGCAAGARGLGAMSPTGAQLLVLYLILQASLFAAALWIRSRARKPHLRDVAPVPELDPHEVAYLSGGAERAADAVLASLVDRGAAAMHPSRGLVRQEPSKAANLGEGSYRGPSSWTAGSHPFERSVLTALSYTEPTSLRDARAAATSAASALVQRLEAAGLVPRADVQRRLRRIGRALALAASALGALLFFVGLSLAMGGWLCALALLGALASWLLARDLFGPRPVHRTHAGDAVLAALQHAHRDLRARGPTLAGAEASLGAALFGVAILGGGSLDPLTRGLEQAQRPVPAAANGNGNGNGGGCGCGSGADGGGCGGDDDGGGCGG